MIMIHDDLALFRQRPITGRYQEIDIFGSQTGIVALLTKDDACQGATRLTWRPLSGRSVVELRARAAMYREMAATART